MNIPKLLAAIEPALVGRPSSIKHNLRNEVSRVLLRNKYHNVVSSDDLNVIKDLRQDSSIIITRADKGSSTVILDKTSYISKSLDLLNVSSTYKALNKDKTPAFQRKLNELITELQKSGKISRDVGMKLRCYTGLCPPFYGLPKIHKPDIPLRPIIDYSRSPLYQLSKYLSILLKPLVSDSIYTVNSPYSFLRDLTEFEFPPDHVMASLDIVSLFTSIPIDFVCNIITNIWPNFQINTKLSVSDVVRLLNFCLTHNCFQFNGNYYCQLTGTAMGSPISVVLAEIVVQFIENDIMNQFGSTIKFWRHYVDDIFLVTTDNSLNDILYYANSVCQSIKFTLDKENLNTLPFLDILIKRVNGPLKQVISTTVYRKNTHTGQYLNFNSNSPVIHKKSVFNTLVHRAEKYCSDNSLFRIEMKKIFNDLRNNGFPLSWLKRVYKDRINSLTHVSNPNSSYVSIPYYHRISELIAHRFSKYNIKVSFKTEKKICSLLCNSKSRTPIEDCLGVVYKIPCTKCDATYIGESSRSFRTRIQEHKSSFNKGDINSNLVQHALDTDHVPDFLQASVILLGHSNYHGRIFLEGLFTSFETTRINSACTVPPEYAVLFK